MVSGCRVYLSHEWGSRSVDHRHRIRAAIRARAEREFGLSDHETRAIENLDALPVVRGGVVSIAHCPEMGGFAWRDGDVSIGLDVEVRERVRPERMKRVAKDDELLDAPSATHLWTAKEAAYKCLCAKTESYYLSDLVISDWRWREKSGPCADIRRFDARLVGTARCASGLSFSMGRCVISVTEAAGI
jgi:4'-phosphopantetheinyl transferase EntD